MTTPIMPFIDQCRETLSQIDRDGLSSSRLIRCLGNGSTYSMFTSDYVTAEGFNVGHKLQRRGSVSPAKRFVDEIGTMAVFAGKDENVLRALPRFFGLLKVEGSPLMALLIEDASKGGVHEVAGVDMSSHLREVIETHVDIASLLGDYRDYMAFRVYDEERILDAEPSPFVMAPPAVVGAREAVAQSMSDFTIEIPAHSPLAVSLQSPPWL